MSKKKKSKKEIQKSFPHIAFGLFIVLVATIGQAILLWWKPGWGFNHPFLIGGVVSGIVSFVLFMWLYFYDKEDTAATFWFGELIYFILFYIASKYVFRALNLGDIFWKIIWPYIGMIGSFIYLMRDLDSMYSSSTPYRSTNNVSVTSRTPSTRTYNSNSSYNKSTNKTAGINPGKYKIEDGFVHDKVIRDQNGNKLTLDHNILAPGATLRDRDGNKKATIESNIWGDKGIIKDANGKKIGEIRKDVWGIDSEVYDSNGKKIGKIEDDIWGVGKNFIPKK